MPGTRLTMDEREEIRAGIERGEGFCLIARRLRRPTSTISREVKHNGGRGFYRASSAHRLASEKSRRPRQTVFEADPLLAAYVEERLEAKDSPAAIAHSLADYLDTTVSTETIYAGIYAQGRRGLRAGLHVHLHRRRRIRKRRRKGEPPKKASPLGKFTLITKRPRSIERRSQVGHWEGDLIVGARGASAVVTLVERVTRFNLLGDLVEGHDGESTLACLVELFDRVPPELARTLTWDQGREMALWRDLEELSGIDVYFAEPHHPFQRGTNEAFNGLARRWLPKGTDLSIYYQEDLDEISNQINDMPRRLFDRESAA